MHVGVAEHEHRVLATELERAADEPLGAPLGDDPAGGGGAGEADVVGVRDDRATHLGTGAGDDLPGLGREAGLLEQLGGEQRGEHGLRVGLGHHRVAGQERRDAVAERHRERVVPRRDDADDTLRHAVDLGTGEHREHAADAPGVEVLVGGAGVVARGEREVGDLEVGVLAGLARLPHDEVDELLLPVEEQVVQPQERRRPVVDGGGRPRRLRPARAGERLGHVGRARLRDVRERRAADRRRDGDRLTGGADEAPRQAGDVRAVEAVGGGGVVLGVGGPVGDRTGRGGLLTHPCSVGRRRRRCYRLVTSSQHSTYQSFLSNDRPSVTRSRLAACRRRCPRPRPSR